MMNVHRQLPVEVTIKKSKTGAMMAPMLDPVLKIPNA
jgi:hypothetical protein